MSLNGIEEVIDDGLVTIESSAYIDIYLREGAYETRQNEVTYELVKHFKETIGFDEQDTALINLLMGAQIHNLATILDDHNVPRPEDSHDDGDVGSEDDKTDSEYHESLDEESNFDSDSADSSHESRGGGISRNDRPSARTVVTPTTVSDTGMDSKRRSRLACTSRPARRNHPTPLRELIPSLQSRSEDIIQRARNFRLPSAEAAASIQHRSESGAIPHRFSLPIRTRPVGNNFDENGTPSPTDPPAMGQSYHGSLGVGVGAGRVSSSFTSRRESPGGQRGYKSDDTSEIITRGIGYIGELFVRNPFLSIVIYMANKRHDLPN